MQFAGGWAVSYDSRSHGGQHFPVSEFLSLAIQDVLALDAVRSPRNGIQALGADFAVAAEVGAITAIGDSFEGELRL